MDLETVNLFVAQKRGSNYFFWRQHPAGLRAQPLIGTEFQKLLRPKMNRLRGNLDIETTL